ncbi:hypothetical protein, partial [Segatella buccae]|uniref:hypothetical protein n=1 Tax=Segatella buccae TaxID=28126 RepID=UPI00195535B8
LYPQFLYLTNRHQKFRLPLLWHRQQSFLGQHQRRQAVGSCTQQLFAKSCSCPFEYFSNAIACS